MAMWRELKGLVAVVLMMVLAGCSSVQVGRDFNLGSFEDRVKQGETTQADIRAWLGEPRSSGIALEADGERLIEWLYFYGKGQLSDMDRANLKVLQVRFAPNGTVRSYNWSGER
ncbi:hypothetical protein BOW53_15410 [Solemya pervernicosa gill symbiont]|uniref:Lipoprotein SmpA/OmlA domain-containing protein n=2 Tax=Gammaproteobacteria incertae sedis TaxID=118884 RepID=A0A1T2L055_9GAMM|nr:hypothetical protein [Candidatus Reidiella endopervernicosa]OOZ38485.1 hypothetical protein BOW53_15410 [Solemya pervernicosa gill symbiont]QKQ26562.1 hypothetical protein HUE57_09910 [Candidatus Reidiella endopervernicosa]